MFNNIFHIGLLLLLVTMPTIAQDSTCSAIVTEALVSVDDACSSIDRNQACYGHNLVTVTTFDASSDEFIETGDTVDISQLASLTTTPLDVDSGIWGVALLSLQANLVDVLPGQSVTFIVFGQVELRNEVLPLDFVPSIVTARATNDMNIRTGPGTSYAIAGLLNQGEEISLVGRNEVGDWAQFMLDNEVVWVYVPLLALDNDIAMLKVGGMSLPTDTGDYVAPMQAFRLTTGIGQPQCAEAPRDGLLVQAPTDTVVHFRINGVDIEVGSTGLLLINEDSQLNVNTFDGELVVTADGVSQTVEPGYQVLADEATPPDEPEAYVYEDVKAAPVQLLPETVSIPIVVPGDAFNWIDTGIYIDSGQAYDIVASGEITTWNICETQKFEMPPPWNEADCELFINGPEGDWGIIQEVVPGDVQSMFPMLDGMHGALVARIGEGEPFMVGTGGTFTAEESGNLQFVINDAPVNDDNEGEFIVIVEVHED